MIRRFLASLTTIATVHVAVAPAAAQDWRTLESSRQQHSDAPIDVHVQYGAGVADIGPASGPWLYRMNLRYDADLTSPMATFDEQDRVLRLGTRSAGVTSSWKDRNEGNQFHAELSDRAPMRLALELGAARADVELGGLRLRSLSVRTGATKTYVRVGKPNVETLPEASIDVGAADVTVDVGGNLRARRVTLNVGAGSLDYDFGGDWAADIDADVNVAMGSLTLRIPADAGVRVSPRTFLVDFSSAGLVRRGDDWESPGYDAASRHVRVAARGAFASLRIVRP